MTDIRKYFLRTERLGFRCWRREDLEHVVSLWGDSRVSRYIDARGELSREQVGEKLEHEIRSQEEHGTQYWPLFRLQDHDFAGCCGLRPHRPAASFLPAATPLIAKMAYGLPVEA